MPDPVVVTPKPTVESKTIWWNILMGVGTLADFLAGSGLIPPPWGMIVAAVGNIALRLVTKAPISGVINAE